MKKNTANRILGRRLARELPNEELERAAAGAESGGYWTWTLLYPSDPGDPRWDGGGSGPIIVATEA
jgi:hypothetical protein